MSAARRVLVIGGGIGSLASARALRPHGIECVVIERAQGWSHPGAGMYLPAQLARHSGVAPLEASSGRTQRHRLDRGGHRQLNCALYRIALTQAR